MRSSYFISPKHYSKVCDIAAEAVVQLYTNTNELYYSDVFSHIINNKLHVMGWVSSNAHFSLDEIKNFILECIEIDIEVILSLEQVPIISNMIDIDSGTFLGYSTNENPQGIPFEHLEVKNLTKFIYDSIDEAVKVGITINGKQIDVMIETNYDDKSIIDLVNLYLSNKGYLRTSVNVSKINNIIYKSGENFILNAYGPRAPYGNTKFVGLDVYRNSKYSHLVSKEVAGKILIKQNLNYSLVELTYSLGNETPIQYGIKGNEGGIHIEHGTFFDYGENFNELITIKNNIIEKIKSNPKSLVELSKWGYFNLNTKYEKL